MDAHHPDIVIWPENGHALYFQDGGELAEAMRATVAELGVPFMAGSPAYPVPRGANQPQYVLHNRAYLLGKDGQTPSWYDKEHLVLRGAGTPLANGCLS